MAVARYIFMMERTGAKAKALSELKESRVLLRFFEVGCAGRLATRLDGCYKSTVQPNNHPKLASETAQLLKLLPRS